MSVSNNFCTNVSEHHTFSSHSRNDGGSVNRKVLEDYYSCNLCSNVFTNIVDLRRHEMEHTGNDVIKLFKGRLAEQNSSASKDVSNNQSKNMINRVALGDENDENCEYFSNFTKKYEMSLQMKMGLTPKSYSCSLCSDLFSSKDNLDFHMHIDHNDETIPLTCKVCGEMFLHETSYVKHCKTHTNIWPFECKLCCKIFSTNELLKLHECVQRGEMPYQCRTCLRSFCTFEALESHKNIHSLSSSYFSSDDHFRSRKKNFGSDDGLRSANISSGSDSDDRDRSTNKRFGCNENIKSTNKRFGSDENERSKSTNKRFGSDDHIDSNKDFGYDDHTRSSNKIRRPNFGKNIEKKKFNCRECDQVFTTKVLLDKHQCSFPEAKTYHCPNCGETFWRKRRLIRHETMHCPVLKESNPQMQKSNAPYQCDECHQDFWRKRHYTRHKIFNCVDVPDCYEQEQNEKR